MSANETLRQLQLAARPVLHRQQSTYLAGIARLHMAELERYMARHSERVAITSSWDPEAGDFVCGVDYFGWEGAL